MNAGGRRGELAVAFLEGYLLQIACKILFFLLNLAVCESRHVCSCTRFHKRYAPTKLFYRGSEQAVNGLHTTHFLPLHRPFPAGQIGSIAFMIGVSTHVSILRILLFRGLFSFWRLPKYFFFERYSPLILSEASLLLFLL